jgi:nicotinate-nucleotide adenylyltransferase
VLLRFDPDHRSATAIRRANAGWAEVLLGQDRHNVKRDTPLRDRLTYRSIRSWEDA